GPGSRENFHKDVRERLQLSIVAQKARAAMLDGGGQVQGVQRFEPVLRPNPCGSIAHGWRYGQHVQVGR
ncbi:MAG: hypothetical protein WB773_13080, partial [Isosphaeraceae bacterium]